MAGYVDIAGCAVPSQLVGPILEVHHRTGFWPVSVARSDTAEVRAILHRHGKHTQAEIWRAWLGGYAAAWGVLGRPNPPGRSTHEERSDGVAYRGPVGRRIASWQCGQDWPDAAISSVMSAYRAMGLAPIHPYAAGVEYHHINLTHAPAFFVPLREGDRGPRVWLFTHRLAVAGGLTHSGAFFSRHLRDQVRSLQRVLHLTPDGVVGPVTWRNVEVLARRARAAHHPVIDAL